MRKWWFLLAALVLWNSVGYALLGRPTAKAGSPATMQTQAKRIVSMGPNLTEILYALDLESNIAGVTIDSDYPSDVATKPKVGGFWQPNIEAIIATEPDLVVTLGFEQQRQLANRLTRIGCATLTLDIETIDDLFQGIIAIGQATGANERAQALVETMCRRMETVRRSAVTNTRPKVLWVVQREPLRVAGRETFANEIIELVGGQNAIGPTLHQYPPIGAEQVIASGIDVIIEPTMIAGQEAAQYEQALSYWAQFANVPAVANQRIYVVNGDLVSRLGPRLCDGIETVAACLKGD